MDRKLSESCWSEEECMEKCGLVKVKWWLQRVRKVLPIVMQIPAFSENRNDLLSGTKLQCETGKRMQPGAAATMWDCLRTGVIVPSEDGVLYWFPLGVQSVIQGKVHGGKRGAVQGLTFQHPFLVISDLIFQFCPIYTRRCWCQSATPWRWDSGKTSCVPLFLGDGVLDQGGGGVRDVGGAAVQEGRWEPVRRGAWTKVHRCHWHSVQYCTGKKFILFPKLFLVRDSSIGDLISHSLTD